jgi:protein involved in polysaccharide export with SLBB domain
LLFSCCLAAFSQISQQTQENKKTKNLIHFGDLIEVDVLGSTEFDWRGTLTPEGFLDGLDFVDEPIYALCQSEESVAAEVVKGFNKILRNPQVAVKILDNSGRAVSYLYGAVKSPHRFQIEREVRLNELLILAGGFDEKASGDIQIIRTNKLNCEGNEKIKNETESAANIPVSKSELETKTMKINISDILKGNNDSNPLILNGDIITVFEADPIYVIGGVSNPRKINSRNQMTVSRAILSAGGVTKNADLKNIVIYRRNKNESLRIEVDLEKIKSNPNEDVVLRKYDIVEVGETGREKKRFPPIVKILDSQTKPLELPLRIID